MNESVTRQSVNTKQITLTGLMAALICIAGPLVLPLFFSPVPLSLATLAIYFASYVLGAKRGTVSVLIYLLIGLVGIPVFSGFTGGPAKLFGPTGGYLIGYLLLAAVCGYFVQRFSDRNWICFLGMAAGTMAFYLLGTIWLGYQGNLTFSAALAAGVLPFIPGDLVKIIVAIIAGSQVKKRLKSAGIL